LKEAITHFNTEEIHKSRGAEGGICRPRRRFNGARTSGPPPGRSALACDRPNKRQCLSLQQGESAVSCSALRCLKTLSGTNQHS
jgi:hypothetical protein